MAQREAVISITSLKKQRKYLQNKTPKQKTHGIPAVKWRFTGADVKAMCEEIGMLEKFQALK